MWPTSALETITSHDTDDTKPCLLLALPRELRDEIYDLCYEHTEEEVKSHVRPSDGTSSYVHYSMHSPMWKLRLTNRQLKTEYDERHPVVKIISRRRPPLRITIGGHFDPDDWEIPQNINWGYTDIWRSKDGLTKEERELVRRCSPPEFARRSTAIEATVTCRDDDTETSVYRGLLSTSTWWLSIMSGCYTDFLLHVTHVRIRFVFGKWFYEDFRDLLGNFRDTFCGLDEVIEESWDGARYDLTLDYVAPGADGPTTGGGVESAVLSRPSNKLVCCMEAIEACVKAEGVELVKGELLEWVDGEHELVWRHTS